MAVRRRHHQLFGLLLCLWATCDVFVRMGSRPPRRRVIQRAANEAMILTTKLKTANSPNKVFRILEDQLQNPIFDEIHASSAYHSLAVFRKKGSLKWQDAKKVAQDRPLAEALGTKVQKLVDRFAPRTAANVLWSVAQLPEDFRNGKGFMNALVKLITNQAQGMKPQEVSNSFWAIARLEPSARDMLPAVLNEIPRAAKEMVPQALSNSLWATARLQNVAPEVLAIVPALAAEIPGKVPEMIPQHLSNCLRSSVQLKDSAPEVLDAVPAIVAALPQMNETKAQDLSNILESLVALQDLPAVATLVAPSQDGADHFVKSAAQHLNMLFSNLTAKDLHLGVPTVLWACGCFNTADAQLLATVAQRFRSTKKLTKLQDFSLCALLWSYQALDTDNKFRYFRNVLTSEVDRRNLTEADVALSGLGYGKWKLQKGH